MGIVYCLALGVYAFLFGETASVALFIAAVGALIGFLLYNWYPARILSGDSLTYCLGSIVAAGVIIGNIEKMGVMLMAPFIIEFILKARSRLKASCLGKLRKDGKLDPPYGKKIYSITHVLMNLKPMTEKEVAVCMVLMEAAVAVASFYLVLVRIV
jgi:UDP-N-acetylglucosamine--dolichyl-phosphate N-acetylglucosaminephosphotransferase